MAGLKFLKKLFRFRGLYSIIFYFALLALLWYLVIPRTSIYFRTFFHRPYFGQLNEVDVVIKKGETFHLYVLGINKRAYYSSTDIKVADVNIFGRVTGYRAGTTFIKVKVDGKVLKCRVRVVELNRDKVNLTIGESYKLKVQGKILGIRWKSSNEKVATVSKKGEVTGKGSGEAIITARVLGKTLSSKVIVKDRK